MTAFEIVNSVGSSLGAVAAVGTAAFAGWGIHRTSSDSREKAQPFMTAEFALAENSDETVQLIVKNSGSTPARNVAVIFDPPIPSGDPDSAAWRLRERYDSPISVIAPGQNFASNWWMNDYTLKNPSTRNIHELPNEVNVTISYSGIDGTQLSDEFALNAWLILLEGQPVSSDSALGNLRTIAKASQKNAAETANLAESVEALRFDERYRRSTD
ncbi:hypothetical protein ACU4IU_16910 [Brevibacterium sp. CSND-B09]|uniref:hypothetical protein n=1 Tax=Brevibacterium sp. CSND-B09 TaxID=3462571 RepID=UPI00406AA9BD